LARRRLGDGWSSSIQHSPTLEPQALFFLPAANISCIIVAAPSLGFWITYRDMYERVAPKAVLTDTPPARDFSMRKK
jgi:hypothetical protein